MHPALLQALLLVLTTVPVAALAQGVEEKSIPEPTQLSVAVTDTSARTAIVGTPTLVESDESTAEIAVIEVAFDDVRHRGIKVLLRRAGQIETLYLDSSEVSQLRDELEGFYTWYEGNEPCEAAKQCILGVARCRPSQTVRQAFCPGLFSTPEGKHGVLISLPGNSFRFPGVEPSSFVSAIDRMIGRLSR